MANCLPHAQEGKGALLATRLVPQGGKNVPMCNDHWQRALQAALTPADRDAIGNAPKLNEVLEKQQEKNAQEAGTKPCKCGCGGRLPANSKFDYLRGHKAKPPANGSLVTAQGAMGMALHAVDAEIDYHERELEKLRMVKQTLTKISGGAATTPAA